MDSDCLWIEMEIKGNEQGILCIGIYTIYWNYSVFCGHSLGKAPGTILGLGSNISHSLFVDWVEHPDIFGGKVMHQG